MYIYKIDKLARCTGVCSGRPVPDHCSTLCDEHPRASTLLPTAGPSACLRSSGMISHSSDEAFKFRCGEYFWNARAAIRHAAARAVAQRVHLAEHTLRRPCASPPKQYALLFPPTAPPDIK